MAIKWSKAQEAAINAKGIDTLVSAGAGSGKTAVLTERIYQLIKSGADISRFLVLTFTNAAASEMKIRVRKKLLDDPLLTHLAVAIENSHIETFDSFNLFLVKKYSFELGVTKNISILDGNIAKIKQLKIIDELLNEQYKKKDSTFLDLVYKYCTNDDSRIKNLILKFIDMAEKQIDRDEFIDNFINLHFDENRLKELVNEGLENNKKHLHKAIELCYQLEDTDDCDNLISIFDDLLSSNDYQQYYEKCLATSFPAKDRKKKTNDGDLRKAIKSLYEKAIVNDYGSYDEIISDYLGNKSLVELIVLLAKCVIEKMDEYKQSVGCYCFNDIQRLAIQALKNPAIREEMKKYFDFIMVDEYQDTSDTQELVLTSIANNNLYMVGDVKQSIYAFRNANCKIFLDKYLNYKKGIGGQEIDLNTSYRSRSEIVSFVNDTFSKLMIPENTMIDYSNGHNFGFGFKDYNDMIDDKLDYNIKVFNHLYEKSDDNVQVEANIIAQDIINKHDSKIKVFEKDKGFVECSWKHFAILIDRKGDFEEYRKVFSERNIPLKVISSEPVTSSKIAQVTKSLLTLFDSIADNRLDNDFRHAFISISRSFLVCTDDNEIYITFRDKLFKETSVYKKIEQIVSKARFESIFTILNELYTAFDLYNNVMHIGNISSNIHKAELFLDQAKNMDALGCGIKDFINYFNDLNEEGFDIDFMDGDTSEDTVTLINFHKSKGLEYQICYFSGLYKGFNGDNDTAFLCSLKYGIVLPLTGKATRSSFFNRMNKEELIQKDLEERLRLFYVAVTRARESITFLVASKENSKRPSTFTDCKCHGDFLKLLDLDSKYDVPLPKKPEYESQFVQKVVGVVPISFKTISVDSTPIGRRRRASKELVEDVDDSLLEFGTRLHYLLEVANYETKDTSYIKENNLRKYVSNVLNCGLFNNVKNEQVLHEYSFFDETNNTNGVIDCMIIKDDEIDIIDFKLKKINDAKYNRQLNVYGKYIESITNKSVKLYLLSSITGEVKEIERD